MIILVGLDVTTITSKAHPHLEGLVKIIDFQAAKVSNSYEVLVVFIGFVQNSENQLIGLQPYHDVLHYFLDLGSFAQRFHDTHLV